MNNKKSTKRTLLTSVLSLVLCMSMLIGTTFAWFTDSVTSGRNKIQSGNLDVELYYSVLDETGAWTEYQKVTKDTKVFNYDLWEPGYTTVAKFKIANEGSLALKYQLTADIYSETLGKTKDGADIKLSDYLLYGVTEDISVLEDRTAAAAAATNAFNSFEIKTNALESKKSVEVGMVITMPTTVGNEANHDGTNVPSIEFGINLLATQEMNEEDSFDKTYDEDASYDDAILAFGGVINLEADRSSAMTVAEDVKVVINMNDYTLSDTLTNNGEVAVNGGTIDVDATGFTNYGDATLENLTINAGTPGTKAYGYAINGKEGSNTVIKNVEIDSDNGGVGASDGAQIEFVSGSISMQSKSTSGRYIFYAEDSGTKITIKGGNFTIPAKLEDGSAQNNRRAYIYAGEGATVEVLGGTFGSVWSTRADYKNGIMGKGTILIKGGTFGFNPSNWVADGYKAEKVGTNWIVVPEAVDAIVSDNAALDTAIVDGADTVMLGSGNYIIPDSAKGKTLTIVGNGETVVATQDDGSYEGCDYSLDGATVTFEGVVINTDSTTYTGYARCNGTYKNCTINGTYTLYGNSVFENCTFNVSGDVYNIWTWGAPNATFKNCTFNSDGKALLLYGTENTNLTVNDCVFNDNGSLTDLKAAIEIGDDYGKSYTLTVNNTTVNGYEINDKGISTGTTLWANKNSMGTDKLNVVIDGVDVY